MTHDSGAAAPGTVDMYQAAMSADHLTQVASTLMKTIDNQRLEAFCSWMFLVLFMPQLICEEGLPILGALGCW